jgi:hypothetical protein
MRTSSAIQSTWVLGRRLPGLPVRLLASTSARVVFQHRASRGLPRRLKLVDQGTRQGFCSFVQRTRAFLTPHFDTCDVYCTYMSIWVFSRVRLLVSRQGATRPGLPDSAQSAGLCQLRPGSHGRRFVEAVCLSRKPFTGVWVALTPRE